MVYPLISFPWISCPETVDRAQVQARKAQYDALSAYYCPAAVLGKGINNALHRVYYRAKYLLHGQCAGLPAAWDALAPSVQAGSVYISQHDPYHSLWPCSDFISPSGHVSRLPFQGRSFPVPFRYGSVLQATYGNYMEPPPLEKRVSSHIFRAYRLTGKSGK